MTPSGQLDGGGGSTLKGKNLLLVKQILRFYSGSCLTLLHSKWPKLHRVLAVLSAIGLRMGCLSKGTNRKS